MADAFSEYLVNIVRYPLLSKQQEIMLARQVQVWLQAEEPTKIQIRSGERAYKKLINCNLRLVVSVAKKFRNRINKSEMLDLVQEGNIGLAHGIKKFDPERGYALSTYVYWWIRQAISRYLSCSDRVIRLPSTQWKCCRGLSCGRPSSMPPMGGIRLLRSVRSIAMPLQRGCGCTSITRSMR